MIKAISKIYPLYFCIDLLLIALCYFGLYLFKHNTLGNIFSNISAPNFQEYFFIFVLWAIFIAISFKRRDLYSTERNITIPREVSTVILSIFYTSILISAIIFFAKYDFFPRQVFLKISFLFCVTLSAWRVIKRLILRELITRGFHNMNVLIVGAGRVGRLVLEEILNHPYWGFKVVGFLDDNKEGTIDNLPILDKLQNFPTVVKKYFIDESVITIPSERKVVSDLIKQAQKMRLGLRIIPGDFEESLSNLSISYLGVIPLLTYKERKRHPAEFALKRVFDFTVSFILLVLLSPLFLIIALLIKLETKGPVFYIHKRTGYKGRVFNFYKFRSMVKEADGLKPELLNKNESQGNIIFKIKQDPRITRVGKVLRKMSLDEFPQLINVLKGDMSLVGSRPFPVEESKKLDPSFLERFVIRPGITGLAQIRGRSDLPINRWVKWDLWYINNWSFWLDLKILFWTLPAVLKCRGAY
jgi:exopolysaccharide biosynthesis polyprenyl glycosylphosphotransferase